MKPLSEQKKICEDVTAGPWQIGWEHENMAEICTQRGQKIATVRVDSITLPVDLPRRKTNAQFIAAARTSWPELIEWARRARALLEISLESAGWLPNGDVKVKKLLEELPE